MGFVTNMTYLFFIEKSRLIKVSDNYHTTCQPLAVYFTLETCTHELGRAVCRMLF
jgi:hypothetical protein